MHHFMFNKTKKKYVAHILDDKLKTYCGIEHSMAYIGKESRFTTSQTDDDRMICTVCIQNKKSRETRRRAYEQIETRPAAPVKVFTAKEIDELQKSEGAEIPFYKTRQWRELRFRALVELGRRCMCCGANNCMVHVDHIKPVSKYPELKLEFSNLQILCEDCNLGKSNLYETDFRNL